MENDSFYPTEPFFRPYNPIHYYTSDSTDEAFREELDTDDYYSGDIESNNLTSGPVDDIPAPLPNLGVLTKYQSQTYERQDFHNTVYIEGSFSKPFEYINCIFLADVIFSSHLNSMVIFDGCQFKAEIKFDSQCVCKQRIFFKNGGSVNKIFIESFAKLSNLVIEGNISIKSLIFRSASIDNFLIQQDSSEQLPSVEMMSIDTTNVSTLISIVKSNIQRISISGILQPSATLIMRQLKVEEIDFNSFSNKGFCSIENLTIDKNKFTYIMIAFSDLGKFLFGNVPISEFMTVTITLSILTGCNFINSSLPDRIYTADGYDTITDSIYANLDRRPKLIKFLKENKYPTAKTLFAQREIYRQIKFTLSKQGDLINEQKFHMLEMEAYRKALKKEGKNRWNRFILWSSYVANEYGLSISRPLSFLLIFSLIVSPLAILSGAIPGLKLSNLSTSKGMSDGINVFLKLINPLHSSEGLFPGWTLIWDIIMRIISGYMVYNIIRASRRFIK